MAAQLYKDSKRGSWPTARPFLLLVHFREDVFLHKSYQLFWNSQADRVRDINNLWHVHFGCLHIWPTLKCVDNPKGVLARNKMSNVIVVIFISIFFDLIRVASTPLGLMDKEASSKPRS